MAVDPELLNKVTWRIPNALVLIGSHADGERNAMTASWVTQLSMEPVLVGASLDATSVTHRLVTAGGAFTVNLWDAEDARVFVKFSKPAVDDGASLNGRPVAVAPSGAPIFTEAAAWLDCVVRHEIDLGTHTLFVGEVPAAALPRDTVRVASLADTRMKYGGVRRH